ncbi:acireductone synthase [Oceanobacter mangrovi]|uniref:acireductone synthase n=1 Tax=Oceanobacter mangrovi TaxID=2862510 RepID=UPI001C8E5D1C|nr:acireductone synthase [Oceanobacter mangrovi]
MSIKVILTDVEGTTSSISFVKEVLFPYAAEHLSSYVRSHFNDEIVQQQLAATAELLLEESPGSEVSAADTDALINILLEWISEDRKATPLKTLQGLIWETGYRNGDYQAHMYPDATANLKQWHQQGLALYVYSSGSVQAQKLFFGFSQDGDLLPLFSGHFDTAVGHKQQAESYRNILQQLQQQYTGLQANEVLFLSDIEGELDAAHEAGLQTCWLLRETPVPANTSHAAVSSFDQIQLD